MSEKKEPITISETPGKKYYCGCGKSKTMPYCDGASHEGSGCKPYEVEIETQKDVALCTCGFSSNLPFCDGSHYNC